jgi:hypothetical protein
MRQRSQQLVTAVVLLALLGLCLAVVLTLRDRIGEPDEFSRRKQTLDAMQARHVTQTIQAHYALQTSEAALVTPTATVSLPPILMPVGTSAAAETVAPTATPTPTPPAD